MIEKLKIELGRPEIVNSLPCRTLTGTEAAIEEVASKVNEIIAHLNKLEPVTYEEVNPRVYILPDVESAFNDRVTVKNNGEWCKACGAWKQYGIADTHHCTGYKVTC